MGRMESSPSYRRTPEIGRRRKFVNAMADAGRRAITGYNPARIAPSAHCPINVCSLVIGSFLTTDLVETPMLIPECDGPPIAVTFSPQLVHGHGRGPPAVA